MILRTSILTLALFSASALAQNPGSQALDDVLTQKEGMSLVSDGLYYQKTDSGDSFVAVNATGKRAILAKMQETRAALAARYQAKGIPQSEQIALGALDNEIARLSQPQPKNQEITYHCGDAATIYARALSSGGTSSSAYAVDQGGGFSPPTSTVNVATASTDDVSHSSTTSTFTAATASATEARSCVAYSSASVTCYGDPSPPTISAFATSQRPGGCP